MMQHEKTVVYSTKNTYKTLNELTDKTKNVWSWLTKVNTVLETENVLTYLDAVLEAENIPKNVNFIVFGFSQGVSIAMRWVAKRQLKCDHLILYAGGMPKELQPDDFVFLNQNETKVTVLVGDNDEYINSTVLEEQSKRIKSLFDNKAGMR